ncbi:hypothetical protein OHA79_50050 (plasmid) [Streptomyces sp. NBC_00841]|uniref:hypothetical protein n=1 Tax=unclassified Streptomyces TaxID=2593676 RepID=UPI00224D7B1C|nr:MULTISPECIES: hypothetical protein [unclassified Streptomyces]MCX4538575.1 hypothetical protein [Streptomyces sp. NBC_01669]WSA05604.1 hypothetical protein OHA79_50050 [Streptomyces sp. NBC_00841]
MFDDVVPTGRRSSAVAAGRPRVLVIGGKLKHVRKARELGLDVVHAQFSDAYDRGHWPYVDQALLLDYGDVDRLLPLAQALHEAYPFQAAVSLFELGLLPRRGSTRRWVSAASPSPPWNCCWTSGGCAST